MLRALAFMLAFTQVSGLTVFLAIPLYGFCLLIGDDVSAYAASFQSNAQDFLLASALLLGFVALEKAVFKLFRFLKIDPRPTIR